MILLRMSGVSKLPLSTSGYHDGRRTPSSFDWIDSRWSPLRGLFPLWVRTDIPDLTAQTGFGLLIPAFARLVISSLNEP